MNLVKFLTLSGHRVHVLCLKTSANELDGLKTGHMVYLPRIRSLVQVLGCLLTNIPLQVSYCRSYEMKSIAKKLLLEKHIDCIHLESLRAAQYISSKTNFPLVFDAVDCLTNRYQQFSQSRMDDPIKKIINLIEFFKLRSYEPKTIAKFPMVTVVSENEKQKLIRLFEKNKIENLPKIEVISNGVDTEYFRPINTDKKFDLIFTGKMSYFANQQAVLFLHRRIMPLIWEKRPLTTLAVVGNGPSSAIKQLDRDDPRITVTGFVPDMNTSLAKAVIAVCPITVGTGIQNKILEAMSMAKPVVATPLASHPLKIVHGENILVADSPQQFADLTLKLLSQQKLQKMIGFNARLYVNKHHRWEDKARQFEQIYRKVIENPTLSRHN